VVFVLAGRFEVAAATVGTLLGMDLVFDADGAGRRFGPADAGMLAEPLAAAVTAFGLGIGLATGFLAALLDRLKLQLQLPAQLRILGLQVGVSRCQLGQALQEAVGGRPCCR